MQRLLRATFIALPILVPLLLGVVWAQTYGPGEASPTWRTALRIGVPGGVYIVQCAGVDDTVSIANNVSAANAAGGGRVLFPAGTCITAQSITIYSSVYYSGQGRNVTYIKLKNSSNVSVFLGANFATLTGTNSTSGVSGWQISNLSIDGNAANNSSGDGIQVYGLDYIVDKIAIKNTAQDGFYSEWSNSFASCTGLSPDCIEAYVRDILIHDYKGNGWTFKGPHDSQCNQVLIWTFSNSTAKGLYVTGSGQNNGLLCSTLHVWGSNQYGLYADSNATGINLSGAELEGATAAQAMVGGFGVHLPNVWLYNCGVTTFVGGTGNVSSTSLVVASNTTGNPLAPGMPINSNGVGTVPANTWITAGTGLTGTFTLNNAVTLATGTTLTTVASGLQFGDVNNNATEFRFTGDGYIDNCPINWVYEGGDNVLNFNLNPGTNFTTYGNISAPSTLLSDQIIGWHWVDGDSVTATACGTVAVNASTMQRGALTISAGSPTACTITAQAGRFWPRAPVCHVTPIGVAGATTAWGPSAVSTTSVTFAGSATATKLYYDCQP